MQNHIEPNKNELILDDEEQSILHAFESGEFESVLTIERKVELICAEKSSVNKRKYAE